MFSTRAANTAAEGSRSLQAETAAATSFAVVSHDEKPRRSTFCLALYSSAPMPAEIQ